MINKLEKENFSSNFRDWLSDDYYHFLEIDPDSSVNDINRAFRLKIKDCNPDVYPYSSAQRQYTEQRLKQLIVARETLTDPLKREQYDNERQMLQECYISYMSSTYNIFEKDKKIISGPKFRSAPGKKLERLKRYISDESKAYQQITPVMAEQVSDIFLLCMSEHQFQ